jgi:hypothetical protein
MRMFGCTQPLTWTTGIVALAMSLGIGETMAVAQTAKSPRDVYVEAWFKETAEADLDAALALYQACLDGAASTDRELAARALLRIARIAQARGDATAAEAHLERLKKEFDGTLAAKEAAERKTGTTEPGVEVQQAAAWLEDMMLNGREVSDERWNTIVNALGIEEVVWRWAKGGIELEPFLRSRRARVLTGAQWMNVATRGPIHDNAQLVILQNILKDPPAVIPDALRENVGQAEQIANFQSFIALCLACGTADAMRQAELALDVALSKPAARNGCNCGQLLDPLLDSDDVRTAPLVRRTLDHIRACDDPRGCLLHMQSRPQLTLKSSASITEFWSRFPEFPVRARVALVERQLRGSGEFEISAEVAERCLADPEPMIRAYAIARLIRSKSPEVRQRAVTALRQEKPPIELGPLGEVLDRLETLPVELLQGTSGSLREFIYYRLLSRGGPPRDNKTLPGSLDFNHPELIDALFRPRHPSDVSLTYQGRRIEVAVPKLNAQQLSEHGIVYSREMLHEVVTRAFVRNDPALTVAAFEALENSFGSNLATGVADLFAALESPEIDARLVVSAGFELLNIESQRRLTSHLDRRIRNSAIERCRNQELLLELAQSIDLGELELLMPYASEAVAFEILKRAPPNSLLAVDAFVRALPGVPEAFAIACERGGDDRLGGAATVAAERICFGPGAATSNPSFESVRNALSGLVLPPELRDALTPAASDRGKPSFTRTVGEIVSRHSSLWHEAFVELKFAKLLQTHWDFRTGDWMVTQEGGRNIALRLLDNPDANFRRMGLWALAGIEDRETIVNYARRSPDSIEPLRALVRVGAIDEVREMLHAKRIGSEDLFVAFEPDTKIGFVRETLLGEFPLANTRRWGSFSTHVQRLAEHLTAERDVELLVRLATFYPYTSQTPISALVSLDAFDRLLDAYPTLARDAATHVFDALRTKTGFPDASVANDVELRTERDELVAEWRKRLAK